MTVGCIVAIVLTVVAVVILVAVVHIYRVTRFKMQRTQGILSLLLIKTSYLISIIHVNLSHSYLR